MLIIISLKFILCFLCLFIRAQNKLIKFLSFHFIKCRLIENIPTSILILIFNILMSFPQPRAPLKAETKVSSLVQLSNNGLYPYWDLYNSGINPYLNVIRRTFASINPFSHQQVPTSERMAVGIRYGSQYYHDDVYPHGVHFDSWFPSHYNPFANPKFKTSPTITHGVQPGQRIAIKLKELGPRFCQRQIATYERCLLANDNREDVCKEQQNDIISICPSFSLDAMKEKKLSFMKVQALNNKKYREVMEVPKYNKGKTVANVPLKSWSDGSRENLRPNTLWADDRYVDVTQDEVMAARERIKKRREMSDQKLKGLPKYDRRYEAPPSEMPLYSL